MQNTFDLNIEEIPLFHIMDYYEGLSELINNRSIEHQDNMDIWI